MEERMQRRIGLVAANARQAAIRAWESVLHHEKERVTADQIYAVLVQNKAPDGSTVVNLYKVTNRNEMQHMGRLALAPGVTAMMGLLDSFVIEGLDAEE
jgi:hypothetical protein